MKYSLLLIVLFLVGCNTNHELMTRRGYGDVGVGMSSTAIEERFGKPYMVYSKGEGTETYEYIEKITMGTQVIEQRRYYIIIKDGKVVGKYMKLSNPPPFEAIYSDDPYPNY